MGLTTGAVTGFLALGVRSDLKDSCGGGVCVPLSDAEYAELSDKRDRYREPVDALKGQPLHGLSSSPGSDATGTPPIGPLKETPIRHYPGNP